MGATAVAGGATFRAWAPNAHNVSVVAGSRLLQRPDLAWRPDPADALVPLGDGSWGGFREGIGDGDAYMFFVEGDAGAEWKRDPYARELTLEPAFPDCFCVVRDPNAYSWHDHGWRAPDLCDLIIYQLHVGTFWAQDESGRDVRATQSGTFLDVILKLGYLRDLGINAVQLLPIQEFETHFSLGYNGVDYFSPETRYVAPPSELPWRLKAINGLLAGFGEKPLSLALLVSGADQLRCLIDLCHLHGIAVIFDVVYNHAGGGFDPRSLWFFDLQHDGDPNRSLYFTDADWAGGQVFAYRNPWVAKFLINNATALIEEYHVDGLRYDEVRVITNNDGEAFCRELTDTVRAVKPQAIQIAEYWNDDRPRAVTPIPGGLGFDTELGDGLRDALRGLLSQLQGGASAMISLSAVAANLIVPASFAAAWRLDQFLENQDLVYAGHAAAARVARLADGSNARSWYARSRSRFVAALLMTAPGIPALFMGQEFLEDKNWSDDPQAGDLIWWEGLSAAAPAMRDHLRFYSDLNRLRRSHPALRGNSARVSRANDFERVIVLHRWLEGSGQDVLVIASCDELVKHGYVIGVPNEGAWHEIFNSDLYDHFPNPNAVGNSDSISAWREPRDGFEASVALNLPANGVIVLARASVA
jgi:1,4-alpha-glucan branching enzyme